MHFCQNCIIFLDFKPTKKYRYPKINFTFALNPVFVSSLSSSIPNCLQRTCGGMLRTDKSLINVSPNYPKNGFLNLLRQNLLIQIIFAVDSLTVFLCILGIHPFVLTFRLTHGQFLFQTAPANRFFSLLTNAVLYQTPKMLNYPR